MKSLTEEELLELTKNNFILADRECPDILDNNISFERFSMKFRDKLLKKMEGRKILYLDTKYWVELRKVSMNSTDAKEDYKNLLEIIRLNVKQGKIICPISTTMFLELIRQIDDNTKYETAKLMQELSLGIGFCFLFERMHKEALNFFLNLKDYKSIDLNIFDNANFVIGTPIIKFLENDDEKEALKLKKSFFYYISTIPFCELVKLIPVEAIDVEYEDTEYEKSAKAINDYRKSNPNMTDKELYHFLIKTVFSGASKDIAKAFIESEKIARKNNLPEYDEKSSQIISATLAIFMEKKKKSTDGMLDCFYIKIVLFYLLMKNKKREIESHDFNDILHASEAIASCDYFFTEKFLSHELKNEKPSLASEYNICVCNKPKEAISALSLL